jgi:hypothetical protein
LAGIFRHGTILRGQQHALRATLDQRTNPRNLSLYAAQSAAFSEHDERIIELFATLAALALAEAQRTDQLRAALINRDVIGQAKGIIMERYKISSEAAFGTLTRISQARNRKLHEVACQVVETGELPQHGRALRLTCGLVDCRIRWA